MREAAPVRPRIADAIVITALIVLAGTAFGPAYGTGRYVAVLATGAVIGMLAALLPALAGWSAWLSAPLAVVGYLLCSGVAVPVLAAARVLPTGETVRVAAIGVVTSWKQALTVAVPVGSAGALLIPVFVTATVLAGAGVLLAVRGPRPPLALLAPTAMMGAAAVLGTTSAWRPAVVGTVLAAAGLVWAGWRRRRAGLAGLEIRRPVGVLLVLVPAVVGGLLLGPSLLPGAERTTLRSAVQPPFDPQAYPSPLAGFRHYVKASHNTVLFTVAGLPAGGRIRLAALDSYDGVVLGTSAGTGTFARVGDKISGAPAGTRATVTVTVDGYADVWMPDAGYLSGVSFGGPRATTLTDDFRYDRDTGTGVVTSGLRSGDTITEQVSVPTPPDPAQLARATVEQVDQPQPTDVPDVIATKAQEFTAGVHEKSPYELAAALAAGLRNAGFFSHGDDGAVASPAGHGADRMIRLLTAPTMVGDQEQYSVAMALMARSLGLPARVVMGFVPHGGAQITGADVTAWVEIPFAGVGWVAFDPTPDQSKVPQQQTPEKKQNAHQQQVQPPPPPDPPERAQTTKVKDAGNTDDHKSQDKKNQDQKEVAAPFPVGVVLAIGVPLVVLLAPLLLIVLAKRRRARRRRLRGSPSARIAGGWAEIVDRSTDLGHKAAPGATRGETSAALDGAYGGSVATLARTADTAVFAPEPVDPARAEAFWTSVREELRRMSGSLPWWRRLRAQLSLASLRRRG